MTNGWKINKVKSKELYNVILNFCYELYPRLEKKDVKDLIQVEAHDRDAKIACIFITACSELTNRSITTLARIYIQDEKTVKVIHNRWRKYYIDFKPLQLDVALVCEKVREIGC